MSALPDGRWTVDASRSSLSFSVRHMGVARVRGSFGSFEGLLETVGGRGAGHGTVRVDSGVTGDELRDRMIRSGDFFDAASHPLIEFRAEAVDSGAGRVELTGELTIAARTQPLRLALEVSPSGGELRMAGSCELSRSDFGLRFRGAMSAGDRTVGDRVAVELELLLVRAA